MKTALLVFAILSIASQIPHAYWVVDYVSNLPDRSRIGTFSLNPKAIQNAVFCLIIANAILFCVLLGLHNWALAGVIIEVIINTYYVYCSYEDKYRRRNTSREDKPRKLAGAYFIGGLIPVCIYVFTWLYTVV